MFTYDKETRNQEKKKMGATNSSHPHRAEKHHMGNIYLSFLQACLDQSFPSFQAKFSISENFFFFF